MVDAYSAGASIMALALRYQCDRSSIRYRLAKAGVYKKKK